MFENANIAFTIAIATVVFLFYLTYNILFRKNSPVKEIESASTHVAKEQFEAQPRSDKSTKDKKLNLKAPPKGKEALFKHKLLSTCLKAHSDKVNGKSKEFGH